MENKQKQINKNSGGDRQESLSKRERGCKQWMGNKREDRVQWYNPAKEKLVAHMTALAMRESRCYMYIQM